MDLVTSDDIRTFLNIYISSIALGTALELGLFWKLAVKPLKMKVLSVVDNQLSTIFIIENWLSFPSLTPT